MLEESYYEHIILIQFNFILSYLFIINITCYIILLYILLLHFIFISLYLHLFNQRIPCAFYSFRIAVTPGTTMRAIAYKRRKAILLSWQPSIAAE